MTGNHIHYKICFSKNSVTMKLGRKEIEQEGSEMRLGSLISDIIGHTGCMWLRLSAYLI